MKLKRIIASMSIAFLLVAQAPLAAMAADATSPDTTTPTTTTDPATQTTPTDTTSPQSTTTPTTDPSTSTQADPSTTPSSTAPATTTDPTTTTPTQPTTGPSQPTGKAPDYAFNDATRKWEATIITSFSWDPTSGLWLSPFYNYDAASGWYHVNPDRTPSSAINALTAGSADPSATLGKILAANDPAISNTGPNSNNNGSLKTSNSLLADLLNNSNINNLNAQTATTGDASVNGNNNGGSATTGVATVVTNLLNLLNAMWTWGSGGFSYFSQNIFDHNGDLKLNTPTQTAGGGSLGALPICSGGSDSVDTTGTGSNNNASSDCTSDVKVHNQNNGSINNNVDALAQSGKADVSGNTNGGNAVSGDAAAEVNIVNLINSAIGAGQTFFGMLNIFGNFNGDILFPGLNLNGAVGSSPSGGGATVSNNNTGPNSNNNSSASNTNNLNLNNNNQANFNNNIDAGATSGAATVTNNTSGGSATTGNAQTNSDAFNLIDTDVFGDNAVLVIINDMGHWVGKILDLGGGSSSGGALLTSNATVSNNNTGPNSNNNSSASNTNNLDATNNNNGTITNNVHARAQSGNANVSGNTDAGGATSGNASVASNIANIFGSHLSIKKVFGILLINIFPGASWNGSVGIDTAAGNQPIVVTPLAASASTNGNAHPVTGSGGTGSLGTATNSNQTTTNIAASNQSQSQTQVLAQLHAEQAKGDSGSKATAIMFIITALILLVAGGLFSLERKLSRKA